MKESRKDGFYWVRQSSQWVILEWNGNYWWMFASDTPISEDYFDEIDERQIVRQEPKILKKAFEAGTNYATYNGRPGYPDAPNFEEWHKTWKK